MITLEQIRLLENKVQKAVALIRSLREENQTMRGSLDKYESRLNELEGKLTAFKDEQSAIEAGVLAALSQLELLEDTARQGSAPKTRKGVPESVGTARIEQTEVAATPSGETDDSAASESMATDPVVTAEPSDTAADGSDSDDGDSGIDSNSAGPAEGPTAAVASGTESTNEENRQLDIF